MLSQWGGGRIYKRIRKGALQTRYRNSPKWSNVRAPPLCCACASGNPLTILPTVTSLKSPERTRKYDSQIRQSLENMERQRMGVDSRGVNRGWCSQPGCNCSSFMSSSCISKCFECNHPPASHIDLDSLQQPGIGGDNRTAAKNVAPYGTDSELFTLYMGVGRHFRMGAHLHTRVGQCLFL